MTRGEIREAIKKVLFEEIEPDSLTKKMNSHLNTGSKKYKSLDGKENFRSKHEVLAYNVFDNEGVLDQIESEAYRFKKTCNKIPDFVWENKKIIIEIAGMNEGLRPGYWKKLEDAKPCFEKQGYTVYIIDTRQSSPYYNYIRFYKHLCDLLGFTPKPEIKNDMVSYVGYPIDLIKRNQELIQYKKDNPNATHQEIADKFNTPPSIVFSILKQAGLTISQSQILSQSQAKHQEIIQYKKDNPNAKAKKIADELNTTLPIVSQALKKAGLIIPRSQTQAKNQPRNQEIIQYKNDNPNATFSEIADKFNTTSGIVFKIFKQAGLIIPRSQTQAKIQARNQEIIQYKNDNPNATQQQIADKFNVPLSTIEGFFYRLKKSNPTNEQSTNNKTMTRKELKEMIKKALKESTTLTKDTIEKKYNEMFGKNPQTTFADVAKALNTTEQAIAMALMGFSLPMEEITIDVPGNPTKLTPQQRQSEINKARQATRKSETGTSKDPVDFV